jgi:hypothetical protein
MSQLGHLCYPVIWALEGLAGGKNRATTSWQMECLKIHTFTAAYVVSPSHQLTAAQKASCSLPLREQGLPGSVNQHTSYRHISLPFRIPTTTTAAVAADLSADPFCMRPLQWGTPARNTWRYVSTAAGRAAVAFPGCGG